jgi:hypothetical protein
MVKQARMGQHCIHERYRLEVVGATFPGVAEEAPLGAWLALYISLVRRCLVLVNLLLEIAAHLPLTAYFLKYALLGLCILVFFMIPHEIELLLEAGSSGCVPLDGVSFARYLS